MEPEILFEDEEMCVISKPSGMVVNRAESVKTETVQEWHERRANIPKFREGIDMEFIQKGGVVHRLDKDTSGVMVLAKTQDAYDNLKNQFLERKTKKVYLALVHGRMKEKEGIISAPIERHPKMRMKFIVGSDLGRPSITEWKVIGEWENYSLVEVSPLTGRTHQIRVHMKHLGHPVVSDPIYGGRQEKEDVKWCPRLFLHAKTLEFDLPKNGMRIKFEAELPSELSDALARLKDKSD